METAWFHYVEVIITTLLSALIGVCIYVFKQHIKSDETLNSVLIKHLKSCGDENIKVARLLVKLEESMEAKHEENRNTNAAFTQAITRLNDKFDKAVEVQIRTTETLAYIKGQHEIISQLRKDP